MGTKISQSGHGNKATVDNRKITKKTSIQIGTVVIVIGLIVVALLVFNNNSAFAIDGTWKSVGSEGFGQAQPGAVVVFDGKNCNFYSPEDTYAFYKEGHNYYLDVTSKLFAENLSFAVKVIDKNQIEIMSGSLTTILKRVG